MDEVEIPRLCSARQLLAKRSDKQQEPGIDLRQIDFELLYSE